MSTKDDGNWLFWGIAIWFVSSLICCGDMISENKNVYICVNSTSKEYHKWDDCSALRYYDGRLFKTKKKYAKEDGYVPCDHCYRN